jgi:serpin B
MLRSRATRLTLIGGALAAVVLIVWASGGSSGTATSRSRPPTPTAPAPARHPGLAPASAIGAFALDLTRRQAHGNLVFSPDSIAAALAVAGSGAAGNTATQMASVLHLKSPQAFAAVGQLQGAIAREQLAAAHGDPQAPTLDLANGLFLQRGFPLEPSYLAGLMTNFAGAAPQIVDFAEPSAVEAINAWVSARTQGIIPRVLSQLPRETRLALANAIYLKAAWLHPFKPEASAAAPFHGEGRASSVAFMNETAELPYGHGQGYAAVDLPYAASTLSLLVVLPVGESVATLQRRLDPGRLGRIVSGLSSTPVNLSLPRFHLASHTLLNGTLSALGMTDAFSERADFSHISSAQALRIGVVDHAADFTVDEHGTVAAAATVVTAEPTAASGSPRAPVAFDADRPFLFFLRDDRTGALLFAGRLSDAASAEAPS